MRIVVLICLTACLAVGVPKTHRCVAGEEESHGCLPAIEGQGNHKVTFVEFDGSGRVLSEPQLAQALQLIREEAASTQHHQIALFAFVHGWKTDARTKNKVAGFEQTLAAIDLATNSQRRARDRIPIVGVYLGWPGSRTSIPGLKELTFWNRKHVAERLRTGDFNTTIEALVSKARERNASSSITLIGHSFGADVLERAVADGLRSRLATAGKTPFRAPADLVLLLNSAANAVHTKQFVDAMQTAHLNGGKEEMPLLLSLTSEADHITRFVLPMGQLPSLMKRKDASRSLYLRSAGNVRLLQSHEFCEAAPDCLTALPDRYNRSPYWIARAPKEVLPDHTSIWGEEFQGFLRAAVDRYGLLKLGRVPALISWR